MQDFFSSLFGRIFAVLRFFIHHINKMPPKLIPGHIIIKQRWLFAIHIPFVHKCRYFTVCICGYMETPSNH